MCCSAQEMIIVQCDTDELRYDAYVYREAKG